MSLAPLRFGAGLKGKIVDSWSHGLPVCTTPIGAEGMIPDAEGDREVRSTSGAAEAGGRQTGSWGGLWTATDATTFGANAAQLYKDQVCLRSDMSTRRHESHSACKCYWTEWGTYL